MLRSKPLSCAVFGFSVTLLCTSCVGTTGGNVVDFSAAASGPADAEAGTALDFSNSNGWQIHLTNAKLHVGAIYLAQTRPTSGAQSTDCILPGTYVAQVTDGLDIDLLSSKPQPFPTRGHGTTEFALSGQVWLTQGPVDDPEQPPNSPILTLEGSATRASDVRPFTAALTISTSNRLQNASASEFASPICKQRIVSPIFTSVQIEEHGGLLLRVDPRLLFVNVDFGALGLGPDGTNYVFADDSGDSSDQPSINLYQDLRAAGGLYKFSWDESL
ncbi:MAG TPA: hypothetical protein VGM44_06270 [Polyangiaceae bacterium]|jgi:hypothetical protein